MRIEIIHLFKGIKISMWKKFGHFLDCCRAILVNGNKITNMDSKKIWSTFWGLINIFDFWGSQSYWLWNCPQSSIELAVIFPRISLWLLPLLSTPILHTVGSPEFLEMWATHSVVSILSLVPEVFILCLRHRTILLSLLYLLPMYISRFQSYLQLTSLLPSLHESRPLSGPW